MQWINGMSDDGVSFCQKAACTVFLETRKQRETERIKG